VNKPTGKIPTLGISERTVEIALQSLGYVEKPRKWPTPGALAQALDRNKMQSPALIKIDDALVRVSKGECRTAGGQTNGRKLMVFMPPQEGKSERCSHAFPEWLLEHNKNLRIAIVSYSDEMARRWGADIKQDVETYTGVDNTVDLGMRLREDSQAAGRWAVRGGTGGVYCVGIRGSLTGKPVDVLIIDDPVKDLDTAQSKANRDAADRFWRAVAIPRMSPDTIVVIIQTRWHEDDLAGRILSRERDQWEIVSIPAKAEAADDPLGRPVGEYMQSVRGDRDWENIEFNVGAYVWAALYQQRPAPQSGGLFKSNKFRYWHHLPVLNSGYGLAGGVRLDLDGAIVMLDDCWRFITVDLAATTSTSADWTVAAAWAVSLNGDLILIDLARDKVEEHEHWDLVRPLRERYAVDTVFVESRMFGTTLVVDATRAGVPIVELKADTDKWTRAVPASTRVNARRAWFPAAADWLDDWVSELASFPNGAHDDQVDVFAYAARAQAAHWTPQDEFEALMARTRIEDPYMAINSATESMTGRQSDPLAKEW
jgi:predicted phage terminase large subunit-like protein